MLRKRWSGDRTRIEDIKIHTLNTLSSLYCLVGKGAEEGMKKRNKSHLRMSEEKSSLRLLDLPQQLVEFLHLHHTRQF